ncbi:hypothetical protein ACJIZ3_016361 [Penstemon smallii]|uniref:Uncharacterized protein n=1 Tax=Penstemon smallii TaxID=265156 RepID=A0ABD3RQE6_9LAMI
MAAIAILDLLRKNPNFGSQKFNSRSLFSTKVLGNSAVTISAPFAFGALFGNGVPRVAYCDAGIEALDEDYISSLRTVSGNIFQNEALIYNTTKQYNVQLKPLFSAFHWKTFALTSLRSFLLFYLPLLEPHSRIEEDDDDFLPENLEENRVDLVVPFKKSVKQIIRETSVVTTRRVLERLAVYYISQRMAWKLLKDVPQSAARKAGRKLSTLTYTFCVSRTTFRGHLLGVLASWIVQVGTDVYRFFTSISKARKENETIDTKEQLQVLGKKVNGITIRCGASLIFASIGAGIGATLVRPSIGQWIGCAIGDLSGPIVVAFCFEKLHLDL